MREIQTDRQRQRETERQRQRETKTQTQTETQTEADGQTETERQTDREQTGTRKLYFTRIGGRDRETQRARERERDGEREMERERLVSVLLFYAIKWFAVVGNVFLACWIRKFRERARKKKVFHYLICLLPSANNSRKTTLELKETVDFRRIGCIGSFFLLLLFR